MVVEEEDPVGLFCLPVVAVFVSEIVIGLSRDRESFAVPFDLLHGLEKTLGDDPGETGINESR